MLNISVVLYRPAWEQEVMPLVEELLRIKNLRKIYLLDNTEAEYRKTGTAQQKETLAARFGSDKLRYMAMEKNLGYGRAHNIALRESAYYRTEFHLVINSDIRVKAEDINAMHDWMLAHHEVGQLMPKVIYPDGTQQYLAKRLPTPLDVFGRRFLPACLMTRRNKRYELRDMDLSRPVNAPYLSGCFMFLRTQAAVEAGLFDERYFMYPEDMDLTRTIHRNWLTLYYPQWTITHAHARSSYKNRHMLWIHIQNMCRYFNKWGWFFDKERRLFNQF
ncbi:MAG: glycosyltransferase family 2 protein [Paludibacteraceae bacterium]|nr:glycosyltransferase family 2 protein [Paludibacteraceae bacterium]